MAQFGRPDSDVSKTSWTGVGDTTNLWNNLDEASASNTDYDWSAVNTAATLEVGLTNVTDPAASTGHTFRYRAVRSKAGVVDGTGNALTLTVSLIQGTTVIATDQARTLDGNITDYSYTLSAGEANAITDYTDLRLRFVTSASGGTSANRRGANVYWAELEVPNAVVYQTLVAAMGGTGGATAVLAVPYRLLAATAAGTGGATGALTVPVRLLAAAAGGEGGATGALTALRTLAASLAGAGGLAGALSVLRGLAAALAGQGDGTGAVTALRTLAAAAPGQGEETAVLTALRALAAQASGEGGATAEVIVAGGAVFRLLAAACAGQGDLAGGVSVPYRLLAGAVSGQGDGALVLAVLRTVSSQISGQGDLAGSLAPLRLLAGILAGEGGLAALVRIAGAVNPARLVASVTAGGLVPRAVGQSLAASVLPESDPAATLLAEAFAGGIGALTAGQGLLSTILGREAWRD